MKSEEINRKLIHIYRAKKNLTKTIKKMKFYLHGCDTAQLPICFGASERAVITVKSMDKLWGVTKDVVVLEYECIRDL